MITFKENSIVTEYECNQILQQMSDLTQVTNKDAYVNYIDFLRSEEKNKMNETRKPLFSYETHHIIPFFDGGTKTRENEVVVSLKEHVIAHWIRWKVYNKNGDKKAVQFRLADSIERRAIVIASIKKARKKEQEQGIRFFDPEFQRAQGLKGGRKGGLANTQKQFEARQKVGTKFGRITGLGNQSPELMEFVNNYTLWLFDPANLRTKPVNTLKKLACLVPPKEAFSDIAHVLETCVPGQIRKISSMHKLIKSSDGYLRKSSYGWSIVNTLIRSEVGKGLETFMLENPNIEVCYDPNFIMDLELE